MRSDPRFDAPVRRGLATCQADCVHADRFHFKKRCRPVRPVEVGSHWPISGRWRKAVRSNACDGLRGIVAASLHRLPEPVCLAFPDDGVGLPEDSEVAKCTSMGRKLAASVAHQLEGRLSFRSCQRCRVEHGSGAALMRSWTPAAVLQE